MTPAARIAAAIDILAAFGALDTPIDVILKRWFKGHRFAGSKDRRSIRDRVYQVVRHRGELVHAVGNESPRLLVAAALMKFDSMGLVEAGHLYGADKYAPDALDDDERHLLEHVLSCHDPVPTSASSNYPQWLEDHLREAFAEQLIAETNAFVGRAPVDLRVNTLKMSRNEASLALQKIDAANVDTAISPSGLRMSESVSLEMSDLFKSGCIEVQDEGSQIAAKMTSVRPGQVCVDFCAGAGGKTLALAADMEGHGQIHCFDVSQQRMAPLIERARRAGIKNFECHVLDDPSTQAVLQELESGVDRVLVDAPCSGTGTWRRAPDAKWLLTQEKLDRYRTAQAEVLRKAASLVCSGGRMVYVTCSILPIENDHQVGAFLGDDDRFHVLDWQQIWSEHFPQAELDLARTTEYGALLTPLRTQTDGFYISILERH